MQPPPLAARAVVAELFGWGAPAHMPTALGGVSPAPAHASFSVAQAAGGDRANGRLSAVGSGTRGVRFAPTLEVDRDARGVELPTGLSFQCITMLDAFGRGVAGSRSLEELRWEDYELSKELAPTAGGPPPVGGAPPSFPPMQAPPAFGAMPAAPAAVGSAPFILPSSAAVSALVQFYTLIGDPVKATASNATTMLTKFGSYLGQARRQVSRTRRCNQGARRRRGRDGGSACCNWLHRARTHSFCFWGRRACAGTWCGRRRRLDVHRWAQQCLLQHRLLRVR